MAGATARRRRARATGFARHVRHTGCVRAADERCTRRPARLAARHVRHAGVAARSSGGDAPRPRRCGSEVARAAELERGRLVRLGVGARAGPDLPRRRGGWRARRHAASHAAARHGRRRCRVGERARAGDARAADDRGTGGAARRAVRGDARPRRRRIARLSRSARLAERHGARQRGTPRSHRDGRRCRTISRSPT